jgi:hypothetical protein
MRLNKHAFLFVCSCQKVHYTLFLFFFTVNFPDAERASQKGISVFGSFSFQRRTFTCLKSIKQGTRWRCSNYRHQSRKGLEMKTVLAVKAAACY